MDRQLDEEDVEGSRRIAVLIFQPSFVVKSVVRKPLVSAIIGLTVLSGAWGGIASADPPHDSVANLSELSQQAEQLTESLRTTQQAFDEKLQQLSDADKKHADDLVALEAAQAQLAAHQSAVNNVAAATYMGGRADVSDAILTAASPQGLIDKLAVQRVVATEMSEQMQSFRRANQEAQAIEAASATSAADAKAAVDEAVAMRADLQRKQSELRMKIANYAMFSPAPQGGWAAQEAVIEAMGFVAPIPTVGMNGLVPNARTLAAYIMATFPGVQSIGGVRADSLPDHPSGHALDIMIGSNMALGDAINADIQSQAGRFGVRYTMWRVSQHFDHVHITVS